MHFLKRRYWLKKPTTSFGIPKFVLAAMIIFLGLNIVSSFRAEASTPASPYFSSPTRPTSSSPADAVGSTLTNVMSASGVPTPTITYQYVRCPSVSGDWVPTCVNIPGATSSTYTLTTDDVGQHIGIRITATNSQGTASQLGVANAKVTAAVPGAPTNITATITGSTTASIAFTAPASNGASITDYDLEYSSNSGSSWTSFSNGTSTANPILVTGLTAKTSYIFRIKAKNSAGEGSFSVASSAATTLMAPTTIIYDGPQNSASPGYFKVGDTITNQSTFDGFPTPTLAFQYFRCPTNDGVLASTYISTGCVDIPGATSSTYILTGDDVGKYMGVKITATNSSGSLVLTPKRNTLVTAAKPGAPTSLSGTAGNGSATISFTDPSSNGGANISNYKYSTNGSDYIALNPAKATSPITIPGLTNGTTYSITLKAVNSAGDSTASTAVSVTPFTTPGAPTSLSAVAGNGSAAISFTAPSSNGGSSITNYKYSTDGSTYSDLNPSDATSPITIPGLANGTTYSITLKAVNAAGDSVASASVSVTPDGNAPTASVTAATILATQNASVQSSEAGTAYLVNETVTVTSLASITGAADNLQNSVSITTANTNTNLAATGLVPGTYKLYTIDGAGNLSAASTNSIAVVDVPGSPASISASITGSTTATVSFTAPASNGGSAINGYTVTSTPSGAVCAVGANSTTYNCTGLAAGTSYTFKVKATNTVGSGSDSVASSPQTTEANPTIAVALEGLLTVVPITVPVRITATASKPGTITFTQDGTNLNQCVNVQTSESGSNYTATCTWTPALNVSGHGGVRSIVATLTPTSSNYQSVNASKSISVTNIGGVNFPAPSITNVVVSGNSATVYFNVGSPSLGPIGFSNDASWINFQYSLDGGTSWNETVTYYYLTSNGDWRNFNAAPSPLVISGLSGQTYNFQIRQQIYHAPGLYPNTYWLVAPSVASPNTGGGSQAYSFTVVAPLSTTTSIATKSLTADTAATSFTPITASGGGSSKTYSISPSLPSGLSLNTSTGAITGTPTGASASTSYTVSVTDGSSTSTATFSLGVNAALSSSAGTVPSGVYKDVAVTAFTPVSFSGGTSPVTYSVSPSLPAGLSLNTSTGVISGTATGTVASTTYTVTATDANGDSETNTFAFAVTDQPTAPGAPTIGAATSTGQTTATVAFTAPASTGGAAITTYTVTASPGGVTATGSSSPITVSGLTAGTAYTFSITATNAAGLTSSSSSPSSSITTESAPVQNNNNGGGGGGGGGAPAPAPEPAPEPVCNAACVAAQNAAAKATADKVAAEKAAAEKLVADKAAAFAVAEKTKVDVSAAVAAATAAAEKVSAATVAKVAVDTIAAAVSTVVNSANAAQTSTSKITSEAAASIKSAPVAATKAASTASANSKANTAATQVKAAATAAQKAAASLQAQTSDTPEIAFGSSNTASAASQAAAKADAAARAGKAAANEVAAAAEAKSIESRARATALQNEANAAVAEAIAEQKAASALATEAKAAADKASTATAEKIAATAAAKTAAETLVTLLTEKVAIAEKVATAASEEIRAEAQKALDTVNIKIAEAERAVTETVSKADAAIAAQAEAIKTAEATKATAEAQVTKVDQLLASVPTKATAAVRAASAAAVAAKVATAAKAAAEKIPSREVISAKPGVSTSKNSTRATISGLKPGQKVKVTVNVKPKP